MSDPHTILSLGHNPTLLTHRHALLTRAGYAVTSAAHPVKAMHLLERRNFDVVVVGLHRHSERLTIEQIQKDKHVPVIFLCCDQFDPVSGTCKCSDAHLSCEELLGQIAGAISSCDN